MELGGLLVLRVFYIEDSFLDSEISTSPAFKELTVSYRRPTS